MQQQKETVREELRRAKKEIQTERLKGVATTAATNIAESVGSLFGSNKVKTLERENTALHREVADHEEAIEALQDRIQTMQADHSRQMAEVERKHRKEIADKDTRHKQEISFLKTVIARAATWFPYFREMLRIENLCRLVGFDERQTATLVKGKPLEYAGELYSEEHGRKFMDVDVILTRYFEEILELCQWGQFDSLAHLTYPLRYITGQYHIPVDLSRYDSIIDEILRTLAQKGLGLEINTAGLRREIGQTAPTLPYIKRFRQLGGEILTFGSDAHRAQEPGSRLRYRHRDGKGSRLLLLCLL